MGKIFRSRWCIGLLCLALLDPNVLVAQIALTGSWVAWNHQDNKIRVPGPDPDTFYGLPINQNARDAALAHTSEVISEVHRQCVPWAVSYITMGPMPLDIWPTKQLDGSVIAWNIGGSWDREPITIWMDGRAAPSAQALKTASGFTTGYWRGDTLVTTTTHLNDGYLYRNGVPASNRAVFTMFITRHENWLTVTGIAHDPVYLTAPYVTSAVFTLDPAIVNYDQSLGATCTPAEEVGSALGDKVPSYLTPPVESLMYATTNYGIPHEAAMGGEQTMYPEYTQWLRSRYQVPKNYCSIDCCGATGPGGKMGLDFNVSVLKCNQINP